MLLRHFQLREQPFGVTPDPRFLFSSATHREALAALVYGIESGLGFVVLTANPGMGKTTILFEALRRIHERAKTVFLFQTITSPAELVRALLMDLGIDNARGSLVELQSQLNQVLVSLNASGKRLVLFIDEAQTLDDSVLEAVRMLSNFETGSAKLMQIVLSGQLQLAERLAGPGLLQLRQRISIFAHLKPLSVTEIAGYVQHRLKTAGWESDRPLFTPQALALITEQSFGIPRNINNLCFNALSLACAMQTASIDIDIIREVVADLDIRSIVAPPAAEPASAPAATGQATAIPIEPAGAAQPASTGPRPVTQSAVGSQIRRDRITVVEAETAGGLPGPISQSQLQPAAEKRTPRGLAAALAGSVDDLCSQWG